MRGPLDHNDRTARIQCLPCAQDTLHATVWFIILHCLLLVPQLPDSFTSRRCTIVSSQSCSGMAAADFMVVHLFAFQYAPPQSSNFGLRVGIAGPANPIVLPILSAIGVDLCAGDSARGGQCDTEAADCKHSV